MSRFKWKDLIQLNSRSEAYSSPLAILSHIDVNAFFAQVEQIRCGYTKDDPVVCVQWNSIIAVSYAARKYGISRMTTIHEALKKSDKIIPIHTAVFRKGEDFWQYHDGCGSWMPNEDKKLPNHLYKVSLDPYRRESRKIFKIFTEYCDLAEKASVDEVFLDLSRICLQRLIFSDLCLSKETNLSQLYMVRETFINGQYQLDSYLPEVPECLKELSFFGEVFNPNNEPLIVDWDDVLFALASQITHEIRAYIEKSLGYTTSCGISSTKTVCKLASNFKKPNAQTIILNRCSEPFLDCGKFEITNFWSLGGILGKELMEILKAPKNGSIRYIREKWMSSPDVLKSYLDNESKSVRQGNDIIDSSKTATLSIKIFELVRGDHRSPVIPQTMVKSMMSNKNLGGNSCKTLFDCISWLEVFSGELSSRLHELEQEYNKIVIPRTLSISTRTKSFEIHSKSGPLIKKGPKIDSQCLLKLGTKLISDLDSKFNKDPNYYPLQNINMTVSNFEVLSPKKSIVDMFGNQTPTSEPDQKNEINFKFPNNNHQESHEQVQYECQPCKLSFDSEKESQEHRDYHLALRISENLNGVDENSKHLSIGEKRLLFTKRKTTLNSTQPSKKPKKNESRRKDEKDRGKSSGNILTYFSKR